MSKTIVSFHAHPDDEVLLTGGTLARAAAEGHRVVIVVATDGEAGLTGASSDGAASPQQKLGERRRAELAASAAVLGAARVVTLGHPDSGSVAHRPVPGDRTPFARLEPQEVARTLADILRQERADVLTTYDAAGGYGHPDHVQVHKVGSMAATMAETAIVLEATVDRDSLLRATRLLRAAGSARLVPRMPDLSSAYTPRAAVTHRIDVGSYVDAKVAAMRAHVSQASGGDSVRTLALLLRLPTWLQRRVLGTEWFREAGCSPATAPLGDVFSPPHA